MEKVNKVVLAYSGGLDTSIAVKWLLENKAKEVVAVAIDVGQKEENLDEIKQKALDLGASASYVIDAREEFIKDYVFPSLKANAKYESGYPLATAIGRPLIAKILNDIAIKENADALAHGCTAKGNDQVRFELAWQALNPDAVVIAPAREWADELFDRQVAIEYAEKNNIPIPIKKKSPYSIDLNTWGRSAECGILEDPWAEPPTDVYALTKELDQTPDTAQYIEIEFERGIPVALDGKKLAGLELVEKLNVIAGNHGIGRYDQIENRLVGIKSREIYEAPAANVLLKAHKELEYFVNTKDVMHFKESIDFKYSELIYNGQWFSPLRDALDGFIEETQKFVTGIIRLKLYKGNATVVGRKSEYSLYNQKLAAYEGEDIFNHESAKGFIDLYGLGIKTYAQLHNK